MKLILAALCSFILVAVSHADTQQALSQDEQITIIQDYLYVMGQRSTMSAASAADMESPDHLPFKCGMAAVAQFVQNRDRLDRGLLSSLGADSLQARPILSDSYGTPSGHFLIHYTKSGPDAVLRPTQDSDGDGVPDYIETMGMIADSVYQRIVGDLQYPAPPSDGFYPSGGDSRFDIYVKHLGASYFGLSYLDSLNLGPDSLQCTAFMLLDNDYVDVSGYQDRPYDAIRVTMAHEFFHAVQFGIDWNEQEYLATPHVGRYWMEMSATWMEEQLYDDINDYYNYLPYFFLSPMESIQQFKNMGDNHPYASVVFPIFLTEKFGPEFIRDIWLRCGQHGRGPSFLSVTQTAIDSVTEGKENWFSVFREFALWNYFTGKRAFIAPNNLGYSEKANYPVIPDSTLLLSGWRQNMLNIDSFPIVHPESCPEEPCINMYPVERRAQHNGMAMIRLERLGTSPWHYLACGKNLDIDTLCVLQYHDSICFSGETEIPIGVVNQSCGLGSVQAPCTLRTDCSSTTRVRVDSTLDLYGGLDTLAPVWGLNIIMQHWHDPDLGIDIDSTVIDSFLLVRPPINPFALFAIATSTVHAERFRQITMILTPATYDYRRYNYGNPMRMTVAISDSVTPYTPPLFERKPAAILSPFPNPSVVPEMLGENMKFRFEAELDEFSLPATADPKISIDIFSVAGEFLTTIREYVTIDRRARLWEAEWDMTNSAGKPVASGVYLCIARLFADAQATSPLVQSTAKVLIVR